MSGPVYRDVKPTATRRDFLRSAAALSAAVCAGVTGRLGASRAAAAEPQGGGPLSSGGAAEKKLAVDEKGTGARTDYRIGCYTRPWDQFEYRVALDGIAEAGYKYAGIMTAKCKDWVLITVDSRPEDVAAIAGEVKKRGLEVLSLYAGEFPVAKSVEAGIAGLKTLIDHSVLLRSPNLLLAGTADEKLVESYAKVVAESSAYAASKGVGLSMKPHGGQNATGPQCREFLRKVDRANFRLWYDPGNIFYYSDGRLDPVDDAAAVDGLVVGVSVKDFKLPKDVLVTPGTGKVRFREVFARLRKGGFTRGPWIVECLDPGDAAKVTLEAAKARRFLEGLAADRG